MERRLCGLSVPSHPPGLRRSQPTALRPLLLGLRKRHGLGRCWPRCSELSPKPLGPGPLSQASGQLGSGGQECEGHKARVSSCHSRAVVLGPVTWPGHSLPYGAQPVRWAPGALVTPVGTPSLHSSPTQPPLLLRAHPVRPQLRGATPPSAGASLGMSAGGARLRGLGAQCGPVFPGGLSPPDPVSCASKISLHLEASPATTFSRVSGRPPPRPRPPSPGLGAAHGSGSSALPAPRPPGCPETGVRVFRELLAPLGPPRSWWECWEPAGRPEWMEPRAQGRGGGGVRT